MLHLELLLLIASPSSFVLQPMASAIAGDGARAPAAKPAPHVKDGWHPGSFESVLADAAKSDKLVMIDFWTSWCGWCKRLDADTLSKPEVASALKDVICTSIDAESESGRPVAERYRPTGFPCLVFLEPDGSERDRIAGFLPPAEFLAELARIQENDGTLSEARERARTRPRDVFAIGAYVERLQRVRDSAAIAEQAGKLRELVQQGGGFDASSPYEQWRVSQILRAAGDAAGAEQRVAAIRALGEEGARFLERRRALDETTNAVNQAYQRERKLDGAPLAVYLASETRSELRFDARLMLRNLQRFSANEHLKANRADEERAARTAARAHAREAWKDCPAACQSDFGRELALDILRAASVSPDELAFAVDVARALVQREPENAAQHDLLGRTLLARGYDAEALTSFERALELDSKRASTRARIDALRKGAPAAH